MKTLITTLLLVAYSIVAQAELKLDSPEKLLERASQNRQELRQVVLDLNQQMPEIRDPRTFESYFFILDPLDQLAVKYNLDDIYPEAVKSLGNKMALFGIKWIDITTFDIEKIPYYMKWFDNDGYASLLAISNYLLKSTNKLTVDQYKNAGEILNLIVQNHLPNVKNRPDIVIGYRDSLSNVATYIIVNNLVSEQDQDFWFNRIYTSTGLSLFLDGIQKRLFDVNRSNIQGVPRLVQNLTNAFARSKELVDVGGAWLKDRVAELSIELVKKSFETNYTLSKEDLSTLINEFSPRYLQSLSMTVISTPENFLIDNINTIENLIYVLQPKLVASYLMTDSHQLDTFAGRSLAAIKIRHDQREGTYKLKDKKGRNYFLTIVSTRPLDLAVTVADENWNVFRNYFYVRYDAATETYTGTYGLNENDNGFQRSLIRIKFNNKNQIEVSDEYVIDPDQVVLKGSLIQPIEPIRFSQRITTSFTKKFKGQVSFTSPKRTDIYEFIIQSNGQNITARFRDKYGPIYDFNQGFVSEEGQLVLNTGRITQTSWAQFRGQIQGNKVVGQFILGGRGIATDTFVLTEVKD